jgi:hypothetical protein
LPATPTPSSPLTADCGRPSPAPQGARYANCRGTSMVTGYAIADRDARHAYSKKTGTRGLI